MHETETGWPGIKFHPSARDRFAELRKRRRLSNTAYLQRLMDLDEQTKDVRSGDGELLVTYRAIVHTPVEVEGTVRRWVPVSIEEDVEGPANNSEF